MHWLTRLSVRRAVLTCVLMLVVVFAGMAGFRALGVDAFPKMDLPIVLVVTRFAGAAPSEVETEVSEPIEAAINTIAGLSELTSQSSEGVSFVMATFDWEKDPDVAAAEVRDHLQLAMAELPRDVSPPIVSKLDPDALPVLYVAVSGSRSLAEATEVADRTVRRTLENVPGVGQVRRVGGEKRQINVDLDLRAMNAMGITASEVERAIRLQNQATPGGRLERGPNSLSVRVQGKATSVDDLPGIVIRQTMDRAVRLGDVARVEDGVEQGETFASMDGDPTVLLVVQKQSGANTVAVADAIQERLDEVRQALPEGMVLEVVRNTAESIRTQVSAVQEHLVIGAVLAALVVLLFLGNLRSTVIAGVSIPISIIGTFALMWTQGFSLNLVTLLALALVVGIVIDDAIVVLENIHRFIRSKGCGPFEAAVLATEDVGLAVLATTLSLMAVFLPVAFMSGLIGQFLRSYGLTMAFAIGLSMLVSFTLTPMLAARWLGTHDTTSPTSSRWERVTAWIYAPLERAYMPMLAFALRKRWVVVVTCAVALASIIPLGMVVPLGFKPTVDEAAFQVNLRAPEGTSIEETRLLAERIARSVRALEGVRHTVVTIGDTDQRIANLAHIYVALTRPQDRDETEQEIEERVRTEVLPSQESGLRIDVSPVDSMSLGQSKKTLQYTISGPDLDRLAEFAGNISDRLREVPGAVDVDTDLVSGNPELRLVVLRDKAAALGVQALDVAATLRLLLDGVRVSSLERGGETYDVVLRASPADRTDVDVLDRVGVPSSRAGVVPIQNVTQRQDATGYAQINRLDRRRRVFVGCNVAPGYSESGVESRLLQAIAEESLPPGYDAHASGMTREAGKARTSFLVAVIAAFIVMYLVLAAQFESWLHPFTIMLSLPLTIPFALVSLLIFGQSLNLMSALGLLVLFGIVKKNSILQVDHTIGLRAQGKGREEAIIEANRDRLRPILMTTIAFVAGMIPLLTARGVGAGWAQAMAGVVVGGQLLSLLLTLLATPVFYSLFDDASVRIRGWLYSHGWSRGEMQDRLASSPAIEGGSAG